MDHLSEYELNAYLDDMFEETERRQVETHLAGCLACRTRLEELQQVFDSLAALPEIELTRDLTPAVLSQLPRRTILFARSRSIAVQWGVVLGVSLWSAMQFVQAIKLPSPQILKQFLLIEIPVLSLATLQFPAVHLPPLELPSFNLPTFGLPCTYAQVTMVIVSTLLLWVIGNLALLRHKPQASSWHESVEQ